MKAGKTTFFSLLCMLMLTFLLLGWQSQTQKLPTRADNGPGFGLLEQARQFKSAQQYQEGFNLALEAGKALKANAEWMLWGESLEEAFQCAYKSKSPALYKALLPELEAASLFLPKITGAPAKLQATIWRRIGSIQHYYGAYDLAAPMYEKALPFAEQLADSTMLMRLYGNVAIAFWNIGDDYRALNYHEKALNIASAKHDTAVIASVLANQGNVWRTIDPKKSIQIYLQSLTFSPDNSGTLTLLSKAYLEGTKNLAKALETAQSALQHATIEEERADALHQMGRVFHGMKQHQKALLYYDQAYAASMAGYGKTHPECVKIHVFKAATWMALKNYEKALAEYTETLKALLPLFNPTAAEQNPSEGELTTTSWWILEALLGKAKVYEQRFQAKPHQDDLMRSLACAELALYYQNKIKLHYGNDESKFSLIGNNMQSNEAALHSAFLLYRLTGSQAFAQRAFRISEQTKAVVLAEALHKKEMKQVANVPATLLDQEKRCQEEIAYFEKKLLEVQEIPRIALLKDSLFQAQRKLEMLEQQVQSNYPVYADALFSYRTDTNVDSVRQQLPPDAAILEYFLGDSALYTFLVTKDTFWAQEQPLPRGFDAAAAQLLRTVNDWRFVADSSALASRLFLENSYRLYQWLLEQPLAVTNAKRLFIVPDGQLSLLPFELLLRKPYAGQWIDRDVPFLMQERAVSYRFSCRSQARKTSAASYGWGGFGLEYHDSRLSDTDARNSRGLRDFGPLPFADDEILAIRGLLGGAFWLNKDATRDNFLQNAERYGILHLAMHGVVDERNPLRSRLLFSNSIAGTDSFVYASDLYNLQLKAGLSVLSACQSGTGAWKKGEGTLSLARAFAFAGCPSMVMSLWNVSDQSTAELMVSFYQQLRDGANKDEALRTAKLKYLQTVSPEYAKPIYWAAFVPIGEMNSLPADYFSTGAAMNKWITWAGVIVLLTLLGFIAQWYWKKG